MPERNVELIERTWQHLVDHPESHDQGVVWNTLPEDPVDCGTVGCFVGWAMHFDGRENYWDIEGLSTDWAIRRLGVTSGEALTIFHEDNTLGMLGLMVKDLLNGEEPLKDRSVYIAEAKS